MNINVIRAETRFTKLAITITSTAMFDATSMITMQHEDDEVSNGLLNSQRCFMTCGLVIYYGL